MGKAMTPDPISKVRIPTGANKITGKVMTPDPMSKVRTPNAANKIIRKVMPSDPISRERRMMSVRRTLEPKSRERPPDI